MKKINTSPLSGMQELLPAEQTIFNNLKSKIAEVYHRHGFQAIETPSIERAEILLAKAGGDTEKQIYKVSKTGNDAKADSKEALRFDHTVPLARYIVEHESQLAFPFKTSQIGLNFRGERAQKGRFREFYQCDIDVIGREKLSLAYDADVISTLLDTFIAFGLDTPVLARINNRKILAGFLEFFNLTDKSAEITNIIDHAEKVTPEQTKVSFEEIGLDQPTIKRLLDFISLHGDRFTIITALNNLEIVNNTFIEGITELDEVLYLLEATGLAANHDDAGSDITAPAIIEADMQIIRGLDYYTGTVFEFNLPEYKNLGSVAGGGRYDNLTKHFSDKSFPGVGGSIGLTRLFYVLNEHHLLTSSGDTLLDYAIIPVSEHEFDESFNVASKLRAKGHSATIVFAGKKLGDKLTYATKVAAQGIILGEEEVKSGTLQAKNFATGEISALNMNVVSNPEDFWTD